MVSLEVRYSSRTALSGCQAAEMDSRDDSSELLQAQLRRHRAMCERRHREPREVMTAELEVVMDPAVGGEKALRMTR